MKKVFVLPVLALLMMAAVSLTACSSGEVKNAGDQPQLTGNELYRQALDASVSLGSIQPYVSFLLDSGGVKFTGEGKGEMTRNGKGQMKGNLTVSSSAQGVPLSMSIDIIDIQETSQDATYTNFKSVTSSNTRYSSAVQQRFAPAIGKWVKMDKDTDPDLPPSFEDDGTLAAISVAGLFAPTAPLNEADKKIFLSAVDKYNLFEVSKDIQLTQFNGVDARHMTVTINKDAFVKFNEEVGQSISKDSEYDKLDQKFIDHAFGKSNQVTAEVYVDPNAAKIIGVDMKITMDIPVKETDFDTTLDDITASLFIDYNRDFTVAPPATFITEKEMDALMP